MVEIRYDGPAEMVVPALGAHRADQDADGNLVTGDIPEPGMTYQLPAPVAWKLASSSSHWTLDLDDLEPGELREICEAEGITFGRKGPDALKALLRSETADTGEGSDEDPDGAQEPAGGQDDASTAAGEES